MSPEAKAPKAKRGFDPRIARIRAMTGIAKQLIAAKAAQQKAEKRMASAFAARDGILNGAASDAERAALSELIPPGADA